MSMENPTPEPEATPTPEPVVEPTVEESSAAEAERVLRFDPFAGPEPEATPKVEPRTETPPVEPKVDGQPPLQPTPEVKPAVDPTVAALLQRQQELMERMAPPKVDAPLAPEQNPFNVQLPEPLLAMVRSEDPVEQAKGLNTIVNGVAFMALSQSKTFFAEELAKLRAELPRVIEDQTSTRQTQQDAVKDFYDNYPKLNSPVGRESVKAAALAVAQDWQKSGKAWDGWTSEFRDAIAEKIAASMGLDKALFKEGAAAPPAPAAPPAKPTQFQTGPSSRPAPAPTSQQTLESLGLDFI